MNKKFKEKSKEKIISSIKDFKLPKYNEIPDVGLFLEQTVKYISSYLEPLECISLTASMISNYVKKKIIDSPNKKQYSKEQIAYLIFIAVTKTVLPLEDIQLIINIQKSTYDLEVAYEYFCSEFENMLFYVFGIREEFEKIGNDDTDEKIMLRNTIITVAHKEYLEKYFAVIRDNQNINK